MNKTFGLVLGLIGIIYIAAVMAMLGIQTNVVLVRRLWPRALLTPFTDAVQLTEADRRAYTGYARAQRHKGFETVDVRFSETTPRTASPQRHEPVAPVLGDDRAAPARRGRRAASCPPPGRPAGPGEASCASSSSRQLAGLGGDQHPVVRRAGRHAEHAAARPPGSAPTAGRRGRGWRRRTRPGRARARRPPPAPAGRSGARAARWSTRSRCPRRAPGRRAAPASSRSMSATVRGWLQVWPCPRSSGPSYDARRTWCGGRNPARGTDSNASLTASTPPVNRASAAAGRTSTCGRRTPGSRAAASSCCSSSRAPVAKTRK